MPLLLQLNRHRHAHFCSLGFDFPSGHSLRDILHIRGLFLAIGTLRNMSCKGGGPLQSKLAVKVGHQFFRFDKVCAHVMP